MPLAQPQEKGRERAWRQGGGGEIGSQELGLCVCVSVCRGQGQDSQEGVHPEGK